MPKTKVTKLDFGFSISKFEWELVVLFSCRPSGNTIIGVTLMTIESGMHSETSLRTTGREHFIAEVKRIVSDLAAESSWHFPQMLGEMAAMEAAKFWPFDN